MYLAPLRCLTAAAIAALLAAAGFAFAVVGAPAQEAEAPIATGAGLFEVDCRSPEPFSHRAHDDPIVFPGQHGASHSHDFLGNRSTDAHSTNDSLREFLTTCVRGDAELRRFREPKDRAAYWVPTLYVGTRPVEFIVGRALYRVGFRARNIQPFPDDLKVIAGSAQGSPRGGVYRWQCPGGYLDRGSETVAPTCATDRLVLSIAFPDCWDGANSDSQDHKSHMAYSTRVQGERREVCPGAHPVPVPALTLEFHYPIPGGPPVRLASGNPSTAHADFMNGWDPEHLAHLIEVCLNADRYCGAGGS
jgi:uncharacterized protein DUF1996